ncbi:MAG: hypothetical protein Q9218_006223 [Villophora microphyllina]
MDLNLMDGQVIRHTYNPGYILLSYFVSFVGCWTALKLLNRRTSRHGYYNWYLLLAAAVAMGGVAIWSMHFIGNRAITMLNGDRDLQIRYSAGCTAGSFFLPICVVSIAFYLLGLSEKVRITRIIGVGIITGAAVCGMHYLGMKGISNYAVSYYWQYVVGSAFIAIVAATVALGVFFYLKTTWTNTWLRRAACASVLAASVSGMHWVATVGTVYRYKIGVRGRGGLTRQATVVVVLCLTFGEVFDIDHPVFTWVYRASHYWPGVVGLIPQMKAHLRSTKPRKSLESDTSSQLSDQMTLTGDEGEKNFGTRFKEHFCVAASELAEIIHEPLENLGVLFESVMSTGTVARQRKMTFSRQRSTSSPGDLERGNVHPMFGRGQVLFLIRKASPQDAARLQAQGFNFASLTNIMSSLAQSMQVSNSELSSQLHRIQRHLFRDCMLPPGIHLGCFAIRPKLHKGWDILVNKSKNNLLPSVPVKSESIRACEMDILKAMNNFTVPQCYLYLQDCMDKARSVDEANYVGTLHTAIDALAAQMDPSLFTNARLLARLFPVPCQNQRGSPTRAKAGLIVFRVMADAHYGNPLNGRCEFVTSRLFRAQQHVYPDSPDHGAFARQIHLEFARLAERQTTSPPSSGPSTPRRPSSATTAIPPSADGIAKDEERTPSRRNPSESLASTSQQYKPSRIKKARAFFGGIHVQQEICVNISGIHDEETELRALGVHSEISLAPAEIDTFADELMTLLLEERRQQSKDH